MTFLALSEYRSDSLWDHIADWAEQNGWLYELGDADIKMLVECPHGNYSVTFQWEKDLPGILLACAFEIKVPERRRPEVLELVRLANRELAIGHLDPSFEGGAIIYQYALLTRGLREIPKDTCEQMLFEALAACERYYAGFQFVVWAGLDAERALEVCRYETAGNA